MNEPDAKRSRFNGGGGSGSYGNGGTYGGGSNGSGGYGGGANIGSYGSSSDRSFTSDFNRFRGNQESTGYGGTPTNTFTSPSVVPQSTPQTTASKPSKVVQVRSLPDQLMEADLIDACAQFGVVNYVSLTGRGTALLEFETLRSAEECVNYNMTTDIFVMSQPAYFQFAPMETIPRRGLESDRPSNCLVMHVQNPRYPISTDVLQAICKPIAPPLRLRILRRTGICAVAEFQDAETARNLKQRLNGCDIYSGCCTLKIEYAKVSRVQVTRNDQDQWDYVGPSGRSNRTEGTPNEPIRNVSKMCMSQSEMAPLQVTSANGPGATERPSLLSEPPAYSGPIGNELQGAGAGNELGYDEFGRPVFEDSDVPTPSMGPVMSNTSMPQSNGPDSWGGQSNMNMMPQQNNMMARNDNYYDANYNPGGMGGGDLMNLGNMPPQDMGYGVEPDGSGINMPNSVIMFYELDEKFNCDRLFNLCCIYGNVMKIKFLKSKLGSAMVQMGDPIAAERCCRFLNRLELFGSALQVSPSKKSFLEDMRVEPYGLKDETPSYKNFEDCRSNRFMTPDAAARNRINSPSEKLYMYNAPPDTDEDIIKDMFTKLETPLPQTVVVFDKRADSRSCAGMLAFSSVSEASQALVLANHEPLKSEASRTPYLIKFCYNSDSRGGGGDGFRGGPRGGRGSYEGGPRGRGAFGRGRGGGAPSDSRINGPQHLVQDRFSGSSGGRGRGDFRGRGRGEGRGRGDFRGRGRGDSRGRGYSRGSRGSH